MRGSGGKNREEQGSVDTDDTWMKIEERRKLKAYIDKTLNALTETQYRKAIWRQGTTGQGNLQKRQESLQ